VFDLNRLAFGDGMKSSTVSNADSQPSAQKGSWIWVNRGAQEMFEEALVQYYVDHMEKDFRREIQLKE